MYFIKYIPDVQPYVIPLNLELKSVHTVPTQPSRWQ